MDVRNCRKCGKLFNYVNGPITCPQCREAAEEEFVKVKKYVYEHSGCGIADVSEACDVPTQQIKQWLREERLEFSSDSSVGLNCENCGVMIRSGRFCEKCKTEMANGLNSAFKKAPEPEVAKKKDMRDSPKMRFLDH